MNFYVLTIGLVLLFGNCRYAFSAIIIKPVLTLSETYNDNIYLESENTDSDWITTVAPGIGLYYDSKELKIDLDYSLRFQFYRDHSEENETNLRDVQRVLADVLFFAERDFTLALREEISRVVIDDREQSVAENELVNKTTLYHFTANPQYHWGVFDTFKAIFEYQYDDYNYVAAEGDDAETQRYGVSLVKSLVTKTNIKLNIFQEDYRAKNQSDYQLQQVSGGLIQQAGLRWQIDAEGGFAQVDFDTGQQVESPTYAVSATGGIAKNLKLILATVRAFSISVDSGLTRITQTSATLHYQKIWDVKLKAYWKKNDFLAENRFDQSFGGELQGGIPLSRRFGLRANVDIGQYEFSPEDEKVLRFGGGVLLDYVGKHGNLSLGYSRRDSNSDIDSNDYINNIITISFSLRF